METMSSNAPLAAALRQMAESGRIWTKSMGTTPG